MRLDGVFGAGAALLTDRLAAIYYPPGPGVADNQVAATVPTAREAGPQERILSVAVVSGSMELVQP